MADEIEDMIDELIDLVHQTDLIRGHNPTLVAMSDKADEIHDLIVSLKARVAELEAALTWIPVSERLPEKTGDYLITDHRGFMGKCFFGAEDPIIANIWRNMFVAWRELPEPYKDA